MSQLQFLKENRDPNDEAEAVQSLNQLRSAHLQPTEPVQFTQPVGGFGTRQSTANDATDGINYDTQSIQSNKHYN